MIRQICKSWVALVHIDLLMRYGGLSAVHKRVRQEQVCAMAHGSLGSDELCHAIDLACVFYFKRVMCLQRSAATAIVLRRAGWEAQLVIGAQLFPLKSHAWVESRGRVLNDKPYMPEIYQVLERC